ncbi:MAG: 5'-nucleotidase C-terminal domain-containing protein [Campylobacterota bacterium]|nr:5'-nucleotidase C-terminal domain-containing protein [Campylobacterota bacterium]
MKKSFIYNSILLLSLTLFILGCGSSKSNTITLIGTSDLQGTLESSRQDYEINGSKVEMEGGGISRVASILKQAKHENPLGTIIASNGDDLMGRYFHTFKGEAIYTLMSQSGYGLYAAGNHEFDKGPEVFARALEYAKFEMICSDLLVENTPLAGKCLPYKIIQMQGAKVGVFSLMTEDLPLVTSPGKVKLKAPNFKIAKEMVEILRRKKCDIIIALTHVGLDQDELIAKNVTGIDVIFGGHSHKVTDKLVRINDTLIFNGGEQGSYVVKLNLPLDSQHHIKKREAKFDRIPVVDPIKPDSSVEVSLDGYKSQLPATVVLGETTVQWNLTSDALRRNESSVADLVNDLLRDKFRVDIVMNNAGAFRGKKVYPPGNITDTMLHSIDEFSNNAYILNIKGQYLREILEHSATHYGEGGLMQVSGIHYTIDLGREAQVVIRKSDGSWVVEQQGDRVSEVMIQAADGRLSPLEDDRVYQVLSNAYLINHNGDGYFWFKRYGEDQKNTYTTFYTVMTGYLENHKILDPKPLDGRLKILNK